MKEFRFEVKSLVTSNVTIEAKTEEEARKLLEDCQVDFSKEVILESEYDFENVKLLSESKIEDSEVF